MRAIKVDESDIIVLSGDHVVAVKSLLSVVGLHVNEILRVGHRANMEVLAELRARRDWAPSASGPPVYVGPPMKLR